MAFKGKRTAGTGIKSGATVREHKAVGFTLESADENTGEFSGYASVFGNVDDGGDIVVKGAFAETIVEDFARIKILALHNGCWLPVGNTSQGAPLPTSSHCSAFHILSKIP